MTDGRGDDVKDRFASRFEDEEESGSQREQTGRSARDSRSSRNAESSRSVGSSQAVGNVKTDWNTFTFYLDDDLAGRLNRLYKKLDWQLEDEYGESLTKTRQYYPLVVRLGLEELDSLERSEVKERLERMEQEDWARKIADGRQTYF